MRHKGTLCLSIKEYVGRSKCVWEGSSVGWGAWRDRVEGHQYNMNRNCIISFDINNISDIKL